MAKNNKLIFSFLLLVLIFGQEIQSIQGRHLKFWKNNEFPKLQSHNKIILEKETRNINNAKQNNNLHGEEFPKVRVTPNANLMSPPAAPSVAAGDQSLPPPPRPRNTDDFKPTAPGHSPGIGHSVQN
ncbi:hypothetical protein Ddye_010490 [Dipteronia dyeriana]|uniref:Uncharacterized protein n=1 Tax=Dipteronia dyeriana TaxID=168575 RepID=A0AAD9XDN2_9ROSI|nr:hypothetical protein Ddye_010490 [Dipteronia dyeriana]